MSSEEPTTPPAPIVPPPPSGPSTTPEAVDGNATDNPIAVAGLVVSLLGLVLSIIVVGGMVGLVGVVLSVIGYRRSKALHRGRNAAIGGVLLGVLSMLFSIAAISMLVATFSGGEEITLNGIATTSRNTDAPPQLDVESVSCESSGGGGLALAVVTITNNSMGQSVYSVTVEWETGSGNPIEDTVRSEFIAAGESEELRLFELTGDGKPDTCQVTRIERSGFGFLTG